MNTLLLRTVLAMTVSVAAGSLAQRNVPDDIIPGKFELDRYPGKVILMATYKHKSRGGFYPDTAQLWLKQRDDGGLTAITQLDFRQTVEVASGDPDNDLLEYRTYRLPSASGPGYGRIMRFEDGKVYRTQRGIRTDEDDRMVEAPEGAFYDPNSRPDPYCAAHILLRRFGLNEGESKEFAVYDVDNSGDGFSGYRIKVEHAGREDVEVPAGRFHANHIVLTQLTQGYTWYKKYPGLVTDFWVLDNGVIVKIVRHREPYEVYLADYTSGEPLPGLIERYAADAPLGDTHPEALHTAQARVAFPSAPPTLEIELGTLGSWQDTRLTLEPGDTIVVQAEGLVKPDIEKNPKMVLSANGQGTANGGAGEPILPGISFGAVIGRVGDALLDDGDDTGGTGLYAPGFIGTQSSSTYDGQAPARLQLAINDANLANNAGAYQARIWILRDGQVLPTPPMLRPGTDDLPRGCVIAGRVTYQGTADPLPGATVTIVRNDDYTHPQSTVSDADGRYALNDLPPGTYTVRCAPPAHARGADNAKTLELESVPQPGSTGQPATLEIVKGEYGSGSTWLDVTQPLAELVDRGSLSIARFHEVLGDPLYGVVKELKVTYRLNGVEDRKSAHDGEVLTIGDLSGRVDFAFDRAVAISGNVTDTEGRPVASADVWGRTWGQESAYHMAKTVTDASGAYTLLGFPDHCEVRVFAQPTGFHGGYVHVPGGRGDAKHIDFTVDREAVLSGRVTDANGRPLAGGNLMLKEQGAQSPQRPGQMAVIAQRDFMCPVDGEGRFKMSGVAPGAYTFRREVRSDRDTYYQASIGKPVTVKAGESLADAVLVFPVPEDEGIAGHVRDASGNPIAGVQAHACSRYGQHWATRTDESGAYCLKGLTEYGQPSVDIDFTGDNLPQTWLRGVAIGTRNADAVIAAPGRISGAVRDASSKQPVVGSRVAVTKIVQPGGVIGARDLYGRQTQGAVAAAFVIEGVGMGVATLTATAFGYQSKEVGDIQVASGADTSGIVIELEKGRELPPDLAAALAPGKDGIVMEAVIDEPDVLHVTPEGFYWTCAQGSGAGLHHGHNEPTYISGLAWWPVWKDPTDEGPDQSTVAAIPLGPTEGLAFEIIATGDEKGATGLGPYTPPVTRQEAGEFQIQFTDSASGSRWYRFRIYRP